MPRISKRVKVQSYFSSEEKKQENVTLANKGDEEYLAVGYSRLSRLNSGNDNEDTIENQRRSIEAYVEKQNDMKLIQHYSDNGFTGSDFTRPGWQKLMESVGNKKVNCIVFKDLSRLGRNFLETSEYLEQIFPRMGVRVISLLDDYDSNAPMRDEEGILIPLKNLMNDMYIKDIKAKGKAVRERKMKDGEYTRAVPPYGYLRVKEKGNTLQIDDEVAWVIRLIFQWRKEERLSTVAIASQLNQMEIMPPKRYQHIKGLKRTKENLDDMNWSAVTVRKMLSNKTYCGYVIQGMVEGRGKNIKQIDESKWKVKENAHKAIITISDYEVVQSSFPSKPKEKKSNKEKVSKGKRDNPFTGLLYCHSCKKRMVSKYKNERVSYACRSRVLENTDNCRGITFGMKTLNEVVGKLLKKQISCILSQKELLRSIEKSPEYNHIVNQYQEGIKHLNGEKIKNIQKQNNLYEDYLSGILEKEEYLYIKKQYIKEERNIGLELRDKRKALATYQNTEKRAKKLIRDMEEFSQNPYLTKEVLQLFIERIEIGKAGTVYITFSFVDILNEIYEITQLGRREAICQINM